MYVAQVVMYVAQVVMYVVVVVMHGLKCGIAQPVHFAIRLKILIAKCACARADTHGCASNAYSTTIWASADNAQLPAHSQLYANAVPLSVRTSAWDADAPR